MIALQHGRVSIALHALREGAGPALLCLHQLGGSAQDFRAAAPLWPGPVFALDFCGHGESGRLRGGAYHPELLAGDADVALAKIGTARVAGCGIGAYVALLLAGARSDQVSAALLLPGVGLEGGGAGPPEHDPIERWTDLSGSPAGCDPAVLRLERDPRPPDYAADFARAAKRLLLAEGDFAQPPWWQAVRGTPAAAAAPGDLASGLGRLAALAPA
jgi:pimeloyl-ACP methyl ester carboxylesterase